MEAGGPPAPSQVPAEGAAPPPGAYPPPRSRPSGGWWAAAVAAVVLALAGGYAFGHSKGEDAKADEYAKGASGYEAIYADGLAAGKKQGEQAGQATGQAEGAKAGFEKGKSQGTAEGTAAGTADGAKAALGGLTDWDTNAQYIVRVAEGPSPAIPFVISTRTEMQTGNKYSLCQSDPSVVCVVPVSGG